MIFLSVDINNFFKVMQNKCTVFALRKGQEMEIQDLKIDANATVGKKLLLTEVLPSFKYEKGTRTDEVSGFKYVVAMAERHLEKLSVKIDGDLQLEMPENDYPLVKFDGLELSIYKIANEYRVAAKAKSISQVKGN